MSLIKLQTEQTDAPDAFEGRHYFVESGGKRVYVTPKERVGLVFPRSLDDKVLRQFVDQNKPDGATHFWAFSNGTAGYVLIYYRV